MECVLEFPVLMIKELLLQVHLQLSAGKLMPGLEVFKNVDADCVEKARKILASDIIDIKATDKEGDFYIHALVESDSGQGECTIRSGHTQYSKHKKK